jgi:hypothetical protein
MKELKKIITPLEKHYPETDSWEMSEIKGSFKQLRLLKEGHPHPQYYFPG